MGALGLGLRTTGLYGRVRHPAFAGLLALTNLLGALTGSPIGAALLASTVPNVVLRIRQEERALEDRFGPEVAAWRDRTWRLIPLVW